MMNYAVLGRSLAIMLATAVPAQAQQFNMPKTIKLHNNATGESIGTLTISGNTAYLRDKNGEHYATIVRNADGTSTTFDPSGKIIEPIKLPEQP
jgi:hypothetical protein